MINHCFAEKKNQYFLYFLLI